MSSLMAKRSKVAGLTAHRKPGDPDLIEARRDLAGSVIEEYVRKVVAQAPPLTDEQRGRIAAILRGPGDGRA